MVDGLSVAFDETAMVVAGFHLSLVNSHMQL